MANLQEHWNTAYTTKAATAVSWYQPHMAISRDLIRAAGDAKASIVDIGGGASTLAEDLLDDGYGDVTALDISATALARSKERMGAKAQAVAWIVADITRWSPSRSWDIWHDRAMFHFLTSAADQDAYGAALRAGTHPGSTAIIATFAADGPERCSGLPVQRFSAEALAARIGAPFALIDRRTEQHHTPAGAIQNFSYAVLRRAS